MTTAERARESRRKWAAANPERQRAAQRVAAAAWEKRHPDRNKAWKTAASQRYRVYMTGRACVECGNPAEVLHHLRDKHFNPAEPRKEETQHQEWEKCEPLCRPCHVKAHRTKGEHTHDA